MTNISRSLRTIGEYRPTKSLWVASCFLSAVVPVFVGLTSGFWITAGDAALLVQTSQREEAKAFFGELCVDRFQMFADSPSDLHDFARYSLILQLRYVEETGIVHPEWDNGFTSAAHACVDALEAHSRQRLTEQS